jgi:GNAT superfamily N-acetyltransferase
VTRVHVRRADTPDVDAAAAVLADAFADYAWTRWTVDAEDHAARIERLQRLVIEQIALPYGEVWVAEDERAAIASVAIWMLPTSVVPTSASESAAAMQAELEGDRHDASLLAEAACAPLRPVVPHYYLGAVGTRPDRQRQGLATAVLAPVLERAAGENAPVFLETSDRTNVELYERLGFSVTGEIDVPNGGPHVWAMMLRAKPVA